MYIQQRAERRFRPIVTLANIFRGPKKAKPRKQPKRWAWNGLEVLAFAKTDARGKLKRLAGLKRLPVGAVVECVG